MAKKFWKSQGILSVQKSGNLGLSTGGGVVSQHALQWYPNMPCSRGSPGPHLGRGGVYAVKCVCWKSQGILSVQKSGNPGLSTGEGGWYPSMHCRWYTSIPCSRGGLQAHTWEGGCVSQHALRQTPRGRLLLRAVHILLECILLVN